MQSVDLIHDVNYAVARVFFLKHPDGLPHPRLQSEIRHDSIGRESSQQPAKSKKGKNVRKGQGIRNGSVNVSPK